MPGELPHSRRLALIEEGFRTLPERYLGAPPGFDATYHVRLGSGLMNTAIFVLVILRASASELR